MKRKSNQEVRYLEKQINKSSDVTCPSALVKTRYYKNNKIGGGKEKLRKNLINQLIQSNWDQNVVKASLTRKRN